MDLGRFACMLHACNMQVMLNACYILGEMDAQNMHDIHAIHMKLHAHNMHITCTPCRL